jgi:hypothetical protein
MFHLGPSSCIIEEKHIEFTPVVYNQVMHILYNVSRHTIIKIITLSHQEVVS